MGLSQQDIEWARSAGFKIPGEKAEQPNLSVQPNSRSLSQGDIEWAKSAGFKIPEIVKPPELSQESILSKFGDLFKGNLFKKVISAQSGELEPYQPENIQAITDIAKQQWPVVKQSIYENLGKRASQLEQLGVGRETVDTEAPKPKIDINTLPPEVLKQVSQPEIRTLPSYLTPSSWTWQKKAEELTPQVQQAQEQKPLLTAVTRAGSTLPLEIPFYATAGRALGPSAGFAALGAGEEALRPESTTGDIGRAATKGLLIGKAFQGAGPSRLGQSAAMGGTTAGEQYLETGKVNPSDIIAMSLIGAAMGGKGNKNVKEAAKDVVKSVGDLAQEAKKAAVPIVVEAKANVPQGKVPFKRSEYAMGTPETRPTYPLGRPEPVEAPKAEGGVKLDGAGLNKLAPDYAQQKAQKTLDNFVANKNKYVNKIIKYGKDLGVPKEITTKQANDLYSRNLLELQDTVKRGGKSKEQAQAEFDAYNKEHAEYLKNSRLINTSGEVGVQPEVEVRRNLIRQSGDAEQPPTSTPAAPEITQPAPIVKAKIVGKQGKKRFLEIVPIADKLTRQGLEALRIEISQAEAGKRIPIIEETRGGLGSDFIKRDKGGYEFMNTGSSFPVETSGALKKDQLIVLDKMLAGKPLTPNQKALSDAYLSHLEYQKGQALSRDSLLEDRMADKQGKASDIQAGMLEVGESVRTPLDTYKVTERSDRYVTLKDGKEVVLKHDQNIPVTKYLGKEKFKAPQVEVKTKEPRIERDIYPPKTKGNATDKWSAQIYKDGMAVEEKLFKTKNEAQNWANNHNGEYPSEVLKDYPDLQKEGQTEVPGYQESVAKVTEAERKQSAQDFAKYARKPLPPQAPPLELETEGSNLFAKQKGLFGKSEAFMGGAGMKTKMEPTDSKPIGTWDIIRHLKNDYDVPLRIGKYNTRAMGMKAAGIYKGKPEVVRLADAKDITSAAHEIGHHIDKTYFGKGLSTKISGSFAKAHWNKEPLKQFRKELAPLDYDQTSKGKRPHEGFAEYIRHRISTGEAAIKAPEFHKWFEGFLNEHLKLKESLNKSEQLFAQWANQGAEARIKGQIDIKGEGASEKFIDKLYKVKRAFQAGFTDDLQVLNYMTEQMLGKQTAKELGDKYPSQHPYKLAIASAKTATAKAYSMAIHKTFDAWGNVTGKGLKEILLPVSKDIDSFLAYAYARRAIELHGRGINPGVTLKDAKYVFDKYNSNPQFAESAKDFTDYFDRVLDYYADAGGLSATQKLKIKEKNQYYIPLKRVFDDKIGGGGLGGKGFVEQANQIKRIKGSGRAIVNPIHSALEMTTKIINASDKLRVIHAVVNLAQKTEGAGWIAEKVPTPKVPVKIKTETLLDAIAKEKGIPRSDPDMADIEMAMSDIDQLVTFEPGQSYYGKDNIVAFPRNGKREFWQLNPELYRAMNGMDNITLGPWLRIIGAPSRAVRLGATGLKASFSLIKNPIRDMWSYILQSEGFVPNPFRWFKGLKSVLMRDENYRRWQRAGGEIAQPLGLDKSSFKRVTDELLANSLKNKSLNIVKHPIEALKNIFSVMEAPARVAEMAEIGGKYPKGSPDSAIAGAISAADVTINFKRMGRYGSILNQIIPFWNALIQGVSKFGRTIKEHPGRSALRTAAIITAPMLALWAMHKDEDWYKEIPRWEKMLFMHFNIGTKEKPTIMRLPLPFEWGILFGSLPVAYLDSKYIENPDAFKESIGMAMEQFTPDFLPAFAKPAIEATTNYNFFKERPIVPVSKQYLPPEEQYSKYTTETAKWLGQQTGTSPLKIEHLVAGHTGGMGLDIIKFMEDGFVSLTKELKYKEPADIPVIGTLFSRQEDAGQSVEDYYDALEKARQSHNAYVQYRKEHKIVPMKYVEGQKPYAKLNHFSEPISEALKDKNYQRAKDLSKKALNRNVAP